MTTAGLIARIITEPLDPANVLQSGLVFILRCNKTHGAMSDLTLVIPVYNEEQALAAFLPELLAFCAEGGHQLVMVDDGSRDGSAALLAAHQATPGLTVLRHKLNRGYGGALKTGLAAAKTRYVITLDADGQHRLADIDRLYAGIRDTDADMIVGRRPRDCTGGWYRRLGKRLIRWTARRLMPVPIEDLNSGMKIYQTRLVQQYLPLCPDSMAFSDTIALIFISQRHLVQELPIDIEPRQGGSSTINTMTALETVRQILNMVVLFNPMQVFLPIALGLFLAGFAWGLPIVLSGRGVSVGALLGMVSGLLFFFLGLLAEQLSQLRRSMIQRCHD